MDATTRILFSRVCKRMRPLTEGDSLLKNALVDGYLAIVKNLYKEGILLDYRAYMAATYRGHLHIIKWLWSKRIYHKDPEELSDNLRFDDGIPFILTAARFNQRLVLNWICRCTDLRLFVYNNSVIQTAAKYNNSDIVKWIYLKIKHVRVDELLFKIILNDNLDLLTFVVENRCIEIAYTNNLAPDISWFIKHNIVFTCSDVAILWKRYDDPNLNDKLLAMRDKMTPAVWHFAADVSRMYMCLDFVETKLQIPFPPMIFMKNGQAEANNWFTTRGVFVEILE